MKQIFLIGLLFLSLGSSGQTEDTEIEPILLDCLVRSYKEKQVDINQELDELESYLINSKSLKSSSGRSYFDFYKQVVHLNDIPVTLDYNRFENIYKLTPNNFYSVDCLEELKRLDSVTINNSKYSQMTVAIQNAAQEEVSPSNIAKAITSVLSPSDFDIPYYRAVALLTIAYTANPDIGLERQLTPNDSKDCIACETMTVLTTDKNQIILNGKEINQDELKSTLGDFVKTNNSNHLIIFQADKGTSYDFYLKVQDQITLVYNELRNELAMEKFNKPFKDLSEEQQKEIKRIYPTRIKE